MPPLALSHSLPLPRGWPRRVRSAVVQVISLARTSLTLTHGWCLDFHLLDKQTFNDRERGPRHLIGI